MLTIAAPDAAELRCNASFQALMWAMARPGTPHDLPEPGLAGVVETLIDLECTVHAADAALRARIAATGATLTDTLAQADHVFLPSLEGALHELADLRCGSDLYPDDGATLVVAAPHHGGDRLRLSGPGIEGSTHAAPSVPRDFWALRDGLCVYPRGFELLLVDGAAVIAVPRSTRVEVL